MSDTTNDVNGENNLPPNVTDIKSAKGGNNSRKGGKNKDKGDDSEPQDKAAELYEGIFRALIDCPSSLPSFPKPDFRIAMARVSTSSKNRREMPILIEGEGEFLTATELDMADVAKMIGAYVREELANLHRKYRFTAAQVINCAEYWQLHAKPLPTPAMFRFKSEPGLAMVRADFDPEPGLCPNWDGIMAGIPIEYARKALMAYFWSIVETKSNNQQYLWLRGEGGDGKSSIAKVFVTLLGLDVGCLETNQPPGYEKFWAIPYENKLYALFADLDTDVNMDVGPTKMLTGGHSLNVRPMRGGAYNVPQHIKTVWLSQKWPVISMDRASLRRVIPVEFHRLSTDVDPEFDEKLWSERAAILAKCKAVYEELCPRHGPIPLDKKGEMLALIQGSVAGETTGRWDDFEEFYSVTFTYQKGAAAQVKDVEALIVRRFRDRKTQAEFRQWLVEIKRHKRARESGGDRPRIYTDLLGPAAYNEAQAKAVESYLKQHGNFW